MIYGLIRNSNVHTTIQIQVISRFFRFLVKSNPNKEFSWAKWLFYPVKLVFGLKFSAILENLLESFFFVKSQKMWFWPIFRHVWPKSAKMRIFIKNRRCYFFTLIVPQLHAKFQKNRWSGFRDQFVTDIRTSGQGWSHRTGHFRWFNIL